MKRILPLFAIIIISCSNPTNKTIFEDLNVEELKSIIKKDTLFENTYKLIEYKKDSVLISELDKVKWSDLTYKRVHKLIQFMSDTAVINPLRKQFKSDWESKYNPILKEIDSVSTYWKNYEKENSLDQYVKVELVKLNKEYYSYIGSIKNVNLGFKMTPLKGKIEQMRFGFKIEAKLDEDNQKSEYSDILSSLDYSWCRMSRPFSKPNTQYWEASYSNQKILKSRNITTLLRDYNIDIIIDEIRVKGVNINKDDLGIPESIKMHWKYENRKYLSDLYIYDVAKEVLKKKYVEDYTFISAKFDSVYSKKDKLTYDFLNLTNKK